MACTAIVWLRRDLRLTDNPAIDLALGRGERPIPVYIQAPDEEAPWPPGRPAAGGSTTAWPPWIKPCGPWAAA